MTLKPSLNVFFPADIERILAALLSAHGCDPCPDRLAGYVAALRDVALAHGLGPEAVADVPEPKRLAAGAER